MEKVLMYQHGGSGNHGCEALADTISKEVKGAFDDIRIVLSSSRVYEDDIDTVDEIVEQLGFKKWSLRWALHHLNRRVFNSKFIENIASADRNLKRLPRDISCAVAIGGDNYCYAKGKMFWATDRLLKKQKKKLLLWGASIEPDDIPGELGNHLKIFDIIVARESITYNALVENGLESKVHLTSDPAFLLEKELLPLPKNWKEGKMVGINLSPLVLRYTQNKEVVKKSIYALVNHIIKNTEMNIVLIPHVYHTNADDISVLLPIYESFKNTGRIILFDDKKLTCRQLKGYISRCRFFVGARTHSIIAAYSTGVPAIALGYSVKAKGIARDLFGSEENLVLPVQTFDDPQLAIGAFEYLVAHEGEIKGIYEERLEAYKEKAKESVSYLKKLMNE